MERKDRSTSRSAVIAADSFGRLSDSLLLLDESEATRLYLDDTNIRRLAQLLWFFVVSNVIYVLLALGEGSPLLVALGGLLLVGNLWLIRERRKLWMVRQVRQVYCGVLIAHLLAYQLFHAEAGEVGVWFVVFPILAARVRLNRGETLALFAALFAITVVRLVGESLVRNTGLPALEVSLFLLLVYVPAAGLAYWASLKMERRFQVRWRSESDRHRDRLRMKQELEYAREIQLSMLPREAPDLQWLDVAALSLPATEVGGDYYDYFVLDRSRVAVVLGDVTGHGVASGLVLSGVRSCLNLLQDDLAHPQEVLARVNTMVKRTSSPRMLMTLAIVVLDREQRSLTVATAGHPPILIARRGAEEIVEVGSGSFPLGAVEGVQYSEDRVALEDGDTALVYSDGIVECLSSEGKLFGWDRLRGALARAAELDTADAVRDAILRDVWAYKGDAEQLDDITMVVLRCQ